MFASMLHLAGVVVVDLNAFILYSATYRLAGLHAVGTVSVQE